jgi:uncharacterized protein (DUF1330 family)
MKGYIIVNARIVDQKLLDDYRNAIGASVQDHEGRIIVASNDSEVLEGEPDGRRTVVLEFPSVAAARSWYDSPEYEGPKAIRLQATTGIALLVEGRD